MLKTRTLTLVAAPIVAVALLTGCTTTDAATPSVTVSASAPVTAADEMFATMMIPHHEQAIEMSDTLLAKSGVDPEVSALAKRVKASQTPEIQRMNGWLKEWGVDASSSMSGMDHGSKKATMSDADMAALAKADGQAASRLYLTQMIAHHQGAITMAEAEQKNGRNKAALALAGQIVAAQKAEIAEMKRLLAGG
ncbi:hypothetical protein LK09_12555 [Microbacterium mangrovi]|uniref:DUF305 domain-containing protein n=1 Tax=Microbacterium mangrovi TaxID=1348253 RepID=A0A0B2A0V3_9MICO|nr:DUF305 domain-containing protein [Microbacterium mangrovi]KHK97105.1 hypothetical protein LK09_12555 [Microbacterium mangrovi]